MKGDIAIVSIGYTKVALPMAQALKVILALKGAVEVRLDWQDGRVWQVEGELEFSLQTLGKGDVFRDSQGAPCDLRPTGARPRAIARSQAALPNRGNSRD